MMIDYLSEQWFREADDALRTSGLHTPDGTRFVVEQQVGETVFHMVFDGDGAGVGVGPAPEPSVVFRQSWETAAAVARGDLSAEEAVLNGHTQLEGDPMAMVTNHRILAKAEDVFAALRNRTVWDGPAGEGTDQAGQ